MRSSRCSTIWAKKSDYEIIDFDGERSWSRLKLPSLVKEGKADIPMKGHPADLHLPVPFLNRETGLIPRQWPPPGEPVVFLSTKVAL